MRVRRSTWPWIVAVTVVLGATCWNVESRYEQQINATLKTTWASTQIERRKEAAGALPVAVDVVDYWGRPFGYFTAGECFVLVSYGSDGVPDRAYDASMCSTPPAKRRNCLRPAEDTIFVNGDPVQFCAQ